MSLFEIWCEQYDRNPKPVGNIDVNTEHIAQRSGWVVLMKALLASAVVGLMAAMATYTIPLEGWNLVASVSGSILIYVGLAFFVVPRPNADNLGWMGGMMDDPFRFSDDRNRWLLNMAILLAPGQFVAGTVLDVAAMFGVSSQGEAPTSFEAEPQYAEASGGYSTANATYEEITSEKEPSPEEKYGLSSAKFLVNSDE